MYKACNQEQRNNVFPLKITYMYFSLNGLQSLLKKIILVFSVPKRKDSTQNVVGFLPRFFFRLLILKKPRIRILSFNRLLKFLTGIVFQLSCFLHHFKLKTFFLEKLQHTQVLFPTPLTYILKLMIFRHYTILSNILDF